MLYRFYPFFHIQHRGGHHFVNFSKRSLQNKGSVLFYIFTDNTSSKRNASLNDITRVCSLFERIKNKTIRRCTPGDTKKQLIPYWFMAIPHQKIIFEYQPPLLSLLMNPTNLTYIHIRWRSKQIGRKYFRFVFVSPLGTVP
jgi:hypothetical protein